MNDLSVECFQPTLEQQFELRKIEDALPNMERGRMEDLLVQATRLLMVKDNIIRTLVKNGGVLY